MKKFMRKLLVAAAVVLVVLYAAATGAFYFAMCQGPDFFARAMRHLPDISFLVFPLKPLWMNARKGTLRVGDAAPDFTLESTDHKSHFQLSSLRGQEPVVLVFGSYT
jgi:hypothetical protein